LEFVHRVGDLLSPHIQCEIDTHFACKIETIRIHVGDHDMTRAGPLANRNSHATDRPGAGNEHIFSHEIERERSVHGIAQRIETGKHIERNRRIGVPAVVLRNSYELRPRTGAIDANALRVWAKMTAPSKTIAAMSTGNVSLADHEIAARKAFHVITYSLNRADKLVANRHRHRNRFLRPRIPIVDMHVSPADRGLQHTNEHVVALSFRNRNFFKPETRLGFGLYDGLHHLFHNRKLGEARGEVERDQYINS